MKVETQVDLTSSLTFHVPAFASHYVEVEKDDDIREALRYAQNNNLEILILGGGSNMLFHNDFEGLVMKMISKGVDVSSDDGRRLEVVVEAGEDWHEFVLKSLSNGWGGLENLALIPGVLELAPCRTLELMELSLKMSSHG